MRRRHVVPGAWHRLALMHDGPGGAGGEQTDGGKGGGLTEETVPPGGGNRHGQVGRGFRGEQIAQACLQPGGRGFAGQTGDLGDGPAQVGDIGVAFGAPRLVPGDHAGAGFG